MMKRHGIQFAAAGARVHSWGSHRKWPACAFWTTQGRFPSTATSTKVGDKLHLFYVPHDGIKYNEEEKK